MPTDSDTASGKRFARDMRRIREHRDVSLDDVHEATRIARNLLVSFEEDGLFTHPAFNRVYLRSLVRSYARCIDLDASVALDALEDALTGDYDDALTKYVDADVSELRADDEDALDPEPPADEDALDPEPPADEDAETASSEKMTAQEAIRNLDSTSSASGARGEIVGGVREHATSRDPETSDPTSDPTSPGVDEESSDEGAPGPESSDEESTEEALFREASSGTASSGADRPTETDVDADADSGRAEDSTFGSPSSKSPHLRPGQAISEARPVESDADGADDEDDDVVGDVPADSSGTDANAATTSESDAESDVSPSGDETPTTSHPAVTDPDTYADAEPKEGPPSESPVQWPVEDESGSEVTSSARPVGARPEPSGFDASESSPSRAPGRDVSSVIRRYQTPIIIGAIAVVGLVTLLVAIRSFTGDASESSGTATPTDTVAAASAADTASTASTTPERSRPPLANVTLGDTLRVTLVAQNDVTGIRIRRDDDLRRPYWIDSGEASAFPFAQRIIIEEELDDVTVLLEGYRYPKERTDVRGRLVISRDTAQAFVDTLRGDPYALDTEPAVERIPPATPDDGSSSDASESS